MAHVRFEDLPVEYYDDATEIPWKEDADAITALEFNTVRNAVLRCGRRYVTVGPMGEAPLLKTKDGVPYGVNEEAWPIECDDPELWVVDDCLWTYYRCIRTETREPAKITPALVRSLWEEVIRKYPRWKIDITFYTVNSVIVLSAEWVRVAGRRFAGCRTIEDVCTRLRVAR